MYTDDQDYYYQARNMYLMKLTFVITQNGRVVWITPRKCRVSFSSCFSEYFSFRLNCRSFHDTVLFHSKENVHTFDVQSVFSLFQIWCVRWLDLHFSHLHWILSAFKPFRSEEYNLYYSSLSIWLFSIGVYCFLHNTPQQCNRQLNPHKHIHFV